MNKLLFLLFTLVIFTSSATAQKVYFTDTSNIWKLVCCSDCYWPYTPLYQYTTAAIGDTLINGKHYSIMYDANINANIVYFRDDTSGNKVVAYINDSTEQPVFDYNLVTGDTFFNGHYHYVVSDTGHTFINSISHRTFKLTPFDSIGSLSLQFTVVEGVGSLVVHPVGIVEPHAECYQCILCMFTSNTAGQTQNPYYSPTTCALSTETIRNKTNISIVPNPADNQTLLKWNYTIKTGSLTIYNTLGQQIFKADINSKDHIKISLDNFTNGQYFYSLTDLSNNSSHTGKFLVEK